jgi:hypothetical protein
VAFTRLFGGFFQTNTELAKYTTTERTTVIFGVFNWLNLITTAKFSFAVAPRWLPGVSLSKASLASAERFALFRNRFDLSFQTNTKQTPETKSRFAGTDKLERGRSLSYRRFGEHNVRLAAKVWHYCKQPDWRQRRFRTRSGRR